MLTSLSVKNSSKRYMALSTTAVLVGLPPSRESITSYKPILLHLSGS